MGRCNAYFNIRYEILKKKYPNHLILLATSKNKLGLKTYGLDKVILEYIRTKTYHSRKKLYEYLKKKEISYIIIDNYNNVKIYSGTNYERYLHLSYINHLLKIIMKKMEG